MGRRKVIYCSASPPKVRQPPGRYNGRRKGERILQRMFFNLCDDDADCVDHDGAVLAPFLLSLSTLSLVYFVRVRAVGNPLTLLSPLIVMMLSSRVTTGLITRQHHLQQLLPKVITARNSSIVLQRCCMSSKSGAGNNNNNKTSSNTSKTQKFSPPRKPGKTYQSRHQPKPLKKFKAPKGPREPNDITRPIPKIDLSKISVTDIDDEELGDDDDWSDLGPIMMAAIQKARHDGGAELDIETQLKMMDYFTSAQGSTEDLVGERRALSLESWDGKDRQAIQDEIDKLIHQERVDYLELPESDIPTPEEIAAADATGSRHIPSNQLAHGAWGELLIRTDRVCKMWRGGRIESYRALVIGGNLRGCAGFGVGKAFEPEDAVELASRMARRNIFFVDRYRNRSLTRDLVGRQNSCKVYLRATDNGLRGNPLCCEILKLMGITNVVAKAHGNRNHMNVVRATFKALQTHESLDEIALKRGVRLVNLQKAKRLQI